MENIAEKIKICNYPQKSYPTISKFLSALTLTNIEQIKNVNEYLSSKQIILKPSDNTVYLNSFMEIKKRVEQMESLNALDAYIENPKRINCKSAFKRMEYLNSKGISLKDENGKYLNCIFEKRLFETKYGVLDNLVNESVQIPEENDINRDIQNNLSVIENPVNVQVNEEKNIEIDEFNPDLSSFDRVKESLKFLDTELSDLENKANALNKPIKKSNNVNYTEEKSVNENLNPIEEILSKPQTVNVDDEAFNKFERLYQSIRHVLVEVYGVEEVNESIANNLMKLVTSGMSDDIEIIYNAITYKKQITEEEKQRLINAINEEVEYTSILDINLGMVS